MVLTEPLTLFICFMVVSKNTIFIENSFRQLMSEEIVGK